MIYYLPEPLQARSASPATPTRPAPRVSDHAQQHIEVFSLVHAQLRRPIAGLDATTLAEVARAVELVPHGDLS